MGNSEKTLFDKIWDRHVVSNSNDMDILFIDKHFIHEVTSPQAFNGLRKRGLQLSRPDLTIATADHNVPTINQHLEIENTMSRRQVNMLTENCKEFGIELFGLGHNKQGIVHVIGPEQGMTRPGMTIVCGDSHTSTHGALGCIAFGIGTSQVEQVFATQCLVLSKPKQMRIIINGELGKGVCAKDIILHIISKLTTAGGTGYFIEYAGDTIERLSMEERMTICNMSIEMGARGGLIAPDSVTFSYVKEKVKNNPSTDWEASLNFWNSLYSDENCKFDREEIFDASEIKPMLTYGTNPGMGMHVDEKIPPSKDESSAKALQYMGFKEGESLIGKKIQNVFIGSCTNARIEDLRIVAEFVKGKRKADHVKAFIVPGSKAVELQARSEGLHKTFEASGFQLREPGCSACLGMNDDKIPNGEYCISTSNRNYEGRQGPGARTILASPLMAAAAAIEGVIVDISKMN